MDLLDGLDSSTVGFGIFRFMKIFQRERNLAFIIFDFEFFEVGLMNLADSFLSNAAV